MSRYNPRWGASMRDKRRRPGWERRPRRSHTETASEDVSEEATATAADEMREATTGVESRAENARLKLLQQATMLWGTPAEYREYLRLESFEAPELWNSVVLMYHGEVSSYRQRMTDERLIVRYDAKGEKLVRDTVSVLRRRRSQLDVPLSTMARSISYFNQRVPTRVWRDQQRGLRIGELNHS